MRTLCCEVKLDILVTISPKAYKAVAFDGSTAILPKSTVLRPGRHSDKSECYWVAEWILKKKDLQYSDKRKAWIDEKGNISPYYIVEKHTPDNIAPVESNEIEDLKI